MYKYTKIQGPRFQRNYIIARDQKSYSVYTWHVIAVIADNKSHAYHKTYFAYNESLKNIPNSRLEYTNHTLFQTKMVEIDTLFHNKTGKKNIPFGTAHTYIAYIRETPPPQPWRKTRYRL